jgi:hypothetical protein
MASEGALQRSSAGTAVSAGVVGVGSHGGVGFATPFKVKPEPVQYEIRFPPGPMGLELEPVIISSERQIGCRVCDFYFELDHNGIQREELLSKVSVGDVMKTIDGQNVLSSKFEDILELLRERRSQHKIVVFKNISASGRRAIFVAKLASNLINHDTQGSRLSTHRSLCKLQSSFRT